MVGVGVFLCQILSLGARLAVLRALRTGIFVLSKKYAASSLTLDVVAEVEVDGWRLGVLGWTKVGLFTLTGVF